MTKVLTLAQFEDSMRDTHVATTPGATKSEYNRWYPRGCRLNLWMQYLSRCARDKGQIIPKIVLDDLYKRGEYRKYHIDSMFVSFVRNLGEKATPQGYVFPWAQELETS